MNEAKKKGLPVFIGVACVWMGTHFGPGVASGTQINVYYTQFGIAGILTLVSVGYTILGYVNLPILIIPAIFLGGRKIKKSYLESHGIEAEGLDE